MAKNINDALENVEMTYSELVNIANEMLEGIIANANNIIENMGNNINSLSLDQIKNSMWNLQYEGYRMSEIKEKSLLKAQLAETLRKEKYASKFNEAQGSAAVKENIALIESSEEQVVEALYDLVANSLKTKLDQIHRAVDCLKSILMTRMQEAKMSINNME